MKIHKHSKYMIYLALVKKTYNFLHLEESYVRKEKVHKPEKSGLTFVEGFGILTKLSGTKPNGNTQKRKIADEKC